VCLLESSVKWGINVRKSNGMSKCLILYLIHNNIPVSCECYPWSGIDCGVFCGTESRLLSLFCLMAILSDGVWICTVARYSRLNQGK
jgi:hypothetical protein